jgi:antitoxin (DNA-binding transcriptional repressor) of toxin-antitoxin stability system
MFNMKSANIRDVQHNLAQVLEWVENGEEVRVFRRKKLVARILPPLPESVDSPAFAARARQSWGTQPSGKPLSDIVAADRANR